MINLASKQKFALVEYLLEKKEFTQYRAKKDLKLGMSTVNLTFQFLLEKELIKKNNGKYVLTNPVDLVELVAFFHEMKKLKLGELSTSLPKTAVLKLLPDSVVFCLETALEQYSNYYKSNNVFFYSNEKTFKEIQKKLAYKPGNITILVSYKQKPMLSVIEKKGNLKFTGKIRTIIDLYSDKKGNAADKLVECLWPKQ